MFRGPVGAKAQNVRGRSRPVRRLAATGPAAKKGYFFLVVDFFVVDFFEPPDDFFAVVLFLAMALTSFL